jgi:hypothetical protein
MRTETPIVFTLEAPFLQSRHTPVGGPECELLFLSRPFPANWPPSDGVSQGIGNVDASVVLLQEMKLGGSS